MSNSLIIEIFGVDIGVGEGAATLCFFFNDKASLPDDPDLFFGVDLKDSKIGLITTTAKKELVF